MAAINGFLKEFLDMRKKLEPQLKNAADAPGSIKIKGGSKTKSKIEKTQQVLDGGLQHIIENKPIRKDVVAYLQKRANELTVEKMS